MTWVVMPVGGEKSKRTANAKGKGRIAMEIETEGRFGKDRDCQER
jgi:hypothetical protein